MGNSRDECIEWLIKQGQMPTGTTITCDDCPDSDNCKWAYDTYNTDGKCLEGR